MERLSISASYIKAARAKERLRNLAQHLQGRERSTGPLVYYQMSVKHDSSYYLTNTLLLLHGMH